MQNQKPRSDYQGTMKSYHLFVEEYNIDKPITQQIRGSLKATGERIYATWMYCYSHETNQDFSFVTSLKSLATITTKSISSIQRHLKILKNAKILITVAPSRKGTFPIEISQEIVKFQEIPVENTANAPP